MNNLQSNLSFTFRAYLLCSQAPSAVFKMKSRREKKINNASNHPYQNNQYNRRDVPSVLQIKLISVLNHLERHHIKPAHLLHRTPERIKWNKIFQKPLRNKKQNINLRDSVCCKVGSKWLWTDRWSFHLTTFSGYYNLAMLYQDTWDTKQKTQPPASGRFCSNETSLMAFLKCFVKWTWE